MNSDEAKLPKVRKAPSDGGSSSPHEGSVPPGAVPDPGGDAEGDEVLQEKERRAAAEQARKAEMTRLRMEQLRIDAIEERKREEAEYAARSAEEDQTMMIRVQFDKLVAMKLGCNSDDSGVPYGKTGASSYADYLQRVSEDLGDVQDWGLPTTMNLSLIHI